MTEFYKAGNYWPDPNCEIVDSFDGAYEVITIKGEDVGGSPSSEPTILFANDEDYEEEEDDDDEDPKDVEYILEDMFLEESCSSSSMSAVGSSTTSLVEPHPYPTSQLFTDELELLLTNVDGNDSDPEVVVIPGPARVGGRGQRRMYRKSMSLPMSPVGGVRERLDSINFSDFLLSPLKLGGLEHDDVDFEDISVRNNEFNLISFMDNDHVQVTRESPVKEQPVVVVEKTKKERVEVVQVQVKQEQQEEVISVPAPPAPKSSSLSKGKCLQLLRATHERQENMVKRCGAIDTQKLITKKNLFPTSTPVVAKKSNNNRQAIDTSLKSDPNWSPEASAKKTSSKTVTKQQQQLQKTGSNSSSSQVHASLASKASLVSGSHSSNLNEIKRRFLANIPLAGPSSSSGSSKGSALKRKIPPQHLKVIKTDVPPIVPSMDHNYCSPVKRFEPVAKRNCAKLVKTTILIDDAPLLKGKRQAVKAEPKAALPAAPQVEIIEIAIKEEPTPSPVKLSPPVVVKRRAINLEDYKRLRNGVQGGAKKMTPSADQSFSVECKKSPIKSEPTEPETPEADEHQEVVVEVICPATGTDHSYVDPISEAKNKALRMQERRKAARRKQEEFTLKTPLVPILPLAVMTGLISEERYLAELNAENESKGEDDTDSKSFSLPFEEIQIVSVGCNTLTTIRPDFESTQIISNLSNQMRAQAPLQRNALLFSIQDVVIKQTTNPPQDNQKSPVSPDAADYSPGKPEGASEGVVNDHTGYHHGEDKVIMHLRKDRIRPQVNSTVCQTDFTPEFPELKRLAAANKRHYRRRARRRRSRHSSVSSDSESDSDQRSTSSRSSSVSESEYSCSEDEFGRSAKRRRLYSQHSRSRSRSKSCMRSRSRYRSRSRSPRRRSWNREQSRSRSRSLSNGGGRGQGGGAGGGGSVAGGVRNTNNRNRWQRNNPSPEERKIVYVGRLESDTTKEELRRKFITYGVVKLVTLHEKTNGTRYGFVTFEEPADAFKAIESAKEDPLINMFDVGFGGRRAFCGASYADLDNVETEEDMYGVPSTASAFAEPEESFESLLQSFKRKVAAVAP